MIQELRVNETELLLRWFDQQRAHAIGILDGLSDEELRRPVLQSGWSCLGMIGHLEGLERFWFRHVVLGDVSATSAVPQDIEWQVDPAVPAAAVFASYRSEIARSNEIIRATRSTRRRPGGRTSLANGVCTTSGRSCCTR
jgi:hypothetical protein